MPVSDSEIPNRAPRVTPDDLTREIVQAHYFTAAEGVCGGDGRFENLDPTAMGPLSLLTICVLELQNGFTILGKSVCASPENFDRNIGQRLACEDARRQMWALLGFRLRDRLVRMARGDTPDPTYSIGERDPEPIDDEPFV